MIAINLLVLRCKDIDATRHFYELIGLSFQEEKHGNGPRHYSAKLDDGLVIELYPTNTDAADNVRIGFSMLAVEKAVALLTQHGFSVGNWQSFDTDVFVVTQDPDGRKVELVQHQPN